jgi:hypothetical protein
MLEQRRRRGIRRNPRLASQTESSQKPPSVVSSVYPHNCRPSRLPAQAHMPHTQNLLSSGRNRSHVARQATGAGPTTSYPQGKQIESLRNMCQLSLVVAPSRSGGRGPSPLGRGQPQATSRSRWGLPANHGSGVRAGDHRQNQAHRHLHRSGEAVGGQVARPNAPSETGRPLPGKCIFHSGEDLQELDRQSR